MWKPSCARINTSSRARTPKAGFYANPAFIEVSGFSREELIGKAHNIVRHPDMPPQAYEDLWRTLQAGESWLGWSRTAARTVATGVGQRHAHRREWRGGGVFSVRVRPTDEQIEMAEALYARIREGRARRAHPTGPTRARRLASHHRRAGISVPPGVRSRMLRHALLSAGFVAARGVYGLRANWDALSTTGASFGCALVSLGVAAVSCWAGACRVR